MPTVTVGRENSADITDFRTDLPKIDVPILVVQGDADRVNTALLDFLRS